MPSEAIAKAVQAGCASLAGRDSAEEALKRLLDLDAAAQTVGEDFFLSPKEWGGVLDRVAQYAQRLCTMDKDPRGIKLAVMCLHLAELLNAQYVPGVRSLQAVVDEMIR
jgi:hypothetical protein